MSAGSAGRVLRHDNRLRRRCAPAVALLAAVLMPGCVTSATPSCTDARNADHLLARYEIASVERFRGGLTSREAAEQAIGLEIVILPDRFQYGETVVDRPAYELRCYPVPAEGEVDSQRWSNFYGFLTSRAYIEVLVVYQSGQPENPAYRFEVIGGGELWRMFDGWLFRLREIAS